MQLLYLKRYLKKDWGKIPIKILLNWPSKWHIQGLSRHSAGHLCTQCHDWLLPHKGNCVWAFLKTLSQSWCQPWAHTAHRAPVSAASCLLSHAETKKWDLAVRLWAENCKYFHKHPCISLIYFILTYTHMYIYKHIYTQKPEKVWRKWRHVCPCNMCHAQGKPRDGARLQLSILPMSQTAAAWAQSWDCSTLWGGLALHHPSTEQMPAADVLHSLGSANSKGCFLSLYLA